MWDNKVGKISAILDSRQIGGRRKQYKCLLEGYSLFKFEWINENNLIAHIKPMIKVFQAWEVEKQREAKTNSKQKNQPLVSFIKESKDTDMAVEDQIKGQPSQPRPKRSKRPKTTYIHMRK